MVSPVHLLLSGRTSRSFLLKCLLFLVLRAVIVLSECLQGVVHELLLLLLGLLEGFLQADSRGLLEGFVD